MTALMIDYRNQSWQPAPLKNYFKSSEVLVNPREDHEILARSAKIIGQALHEHTKIETHEDYDDEKNSFFICDLGEVYRLYNYWKHKLPRVKPHYAIKCNTNIEIIRLLADLGCNFDCASKMEMQTILNEGIDASRIIFSNPCKVNSHLKFAKDRHIGLTVFDNEDELIKMARIYPDCRALLRIETNDKAAVVRLSTKYGAKADKIDALLHKAKELNINLVGVHFHCGAGSEEHDSIVEAIQDAKAIFTKAEALGFPPLSVLDIGGGFMITNAFDQVAAVLNKTLDHYFPASSGVEIISEPGRYFVTTAFTLATNIIGRRGSFVDSVQEPPMIYINDGIYANMNCVINDHYVPIPKVLVCDQCFKYSDEFESDPKNEEHEGKYEVAIWGQTCDSADFIDKDTFVNYPINVGDWLFFRDMGAYTLAATTSFNGFNQHSEIIYVSSEESVKLD